MAEDGAETFRHSTPCPHRVGAAAPLISEHGGACAEQLHLQSFG